MRLIKLMVVHDSFDEFVLSIITDAFYEAGYNLIGIENPNKVDADYAVHIVRRKEDEEQI